MKEEALSLTNMCHLLIIIMIKLCQNRDNSCFFSFWDALYIYICVCVHIHVGVRNS